MTLAVAFIRRLPEREDRSELVFASDSRLSGGQQMDHGAKIFELPRSDALLAFAGDTTYAYPLAAHLLTSIRIYPRSADRRYPLARARGHMLRVFDQVYHAIHGFPVGHNQPLAAQPVVQFLFGGFAWHEADFRIWYIDLDQATGRFAFRNGRSFWFIGDPVAVVGAVQQTHQLLASRGRTPDGIDMEPFEVLREIIRSAAFPAIGGVPQIAKVYRHMNTQFFATLWDVAGVPTPHVFGRPLLGPESCSWPRFDPDTLHFTA